MLDLIVLAAVAGGAPRPDLAALSLKVSTTKSTLLVGEPARLVVTWSVSRPIDVVTSQLRLFIHDARAVREWNETKFGIAQELEVSAPLEPGRPLRTTHVLAVTGTPSFTGGKVLTTGRFAFALPKAGTYRVRAAYEDVVSAWLKIRAVRPVGEDAEVFEQHIKPQPHILTRYFAIIDETVLRDLFRRYPRSPYLEETKRMFFENREDEVGATSPAR